MNIAAGTRLGPYEVVAPLGAGGMGEVYRARDTRLERSVAIKVLPNEVAENAQLKLRFEQEAKTISTLNHPHICSLYDVGHQEGTDFLVMEYCEGETLAQRLTKGPLPVQQVIRYGIEIADALDKAHKQGIIHRDLKPSNIMLTKSGAKLLDFGLAKYRQPKGGPLGGLSAIPTEQQPLTAQGTILGTFQYMAPEQLEGNEADARTDIFAFGAVLYEMATGRKAFEGKSKTSLIAAIVSGEPPAMSSLQPLTPPALERLIKTCLAKDPDERWQTAHDIAIELRWLSQPEREDKQPARVGQRWMLLAAIAGSLLLGLSAGAVLWRTRQVQDRVISFSITAPENTVLASIGLTAGAPQFAISPDGQRLAFVAAPHHGRPVIWVRPLDSVVAQALAGTEGASAPFWSPDSKAMAFFADGKLKRVDAAGGPVQTLSDVAPDHRGGAWGRDDTIVFAPSIGEPLYRISAAGGASTPVTRLDPSGQQRSHRWPHFLPDGRHFLFLVMSGDERHRGIHVGSLDSLESKLLLNVNSNVAYAPPGYLLYARGATLYAQAFDPDRLQFTGQPFALIQQVWYAPGVRYAAFSVSGTGMLAHSPMPDLDYQLTWMSRDGTVLERVHAADDHSNPSLSPDGRRVAMNGVDHEIGTMDVWILDLQRKALSRLTFDAADDSEAVWSPDGRELVFESNRRGLPDLYRKSATGAGKEELLVKSVAASFTTDWSRDGRFLLYEERQAKTKVDIWTYSFEEKKSEPFLVTNFNERQGRFSPNGRWVAYTSDETGRAEVYVRSFRGSDTKWQVSTSGGTDPRWGPDGKELFFLDRDRVLMVVKLDERGSLEFHTPTRLFSAGPEGVWLGFGSPYCVAADGQKILVNAPSRESLPTTISLITNWRSLVRQ